MTVASSDPASGTSAAPLITPTRGLVVVPPLRGYQEPECRIALVALADGLRSRIAATRRETYLLSRVAKAIACPRRSIAGDEKCCFYAMEHLVDYYTDRWKTLEFDAHELAAAWHARAFVDQTRKETVHA